MNSAEEFSKTMFGEEFKMKVPIEKVDTNSSFIGVFGFSVDFQLLSLLFFDNRAPLSHCSWSLVPSGLTKLPIPKLRCSVNRPNTRTW